MDFLVGISPWYWVAFGIVLGVLEMVTFSFFLIWPALAALILAGMLWVIPDFSGPAQITSFAVLSIALTLIGRKVLLQYGDGGGEETLINNRAAQLVGRTGTVISTGAHEGAIDVDGIRWRANWESTPNLAEGTPVRVIANRGMTLDVETLS